MTWLAFLIYFTLINLNTHDFLFLRLPLAYSCVIILYGFNFFLQIWMFAYIIYLIWKGEIILDQAVEFFSNKGDEAFYFGISSGGLPVCQATEQ